MVGATVDGDMGARAEKKAATKTSLILDDPIASAVPSNKKERRR
jgi:hypothetical protein